MGECGSLWVNVEVCGCGGLWAYLGVFMGLWTSMNFPVCCDNRTGWQRER